MKHFLSALFAFVFLAHCAMAQTFAIKGKLIDKNTGEGLPGASVVVKNANTNTGGLTEVNGTFKVENLSPGTYSVSASYIGYLAYTETVVISGKDAFITFRLNEDNATLNEVEIVADVARERETPVAFSAIKESTIKESLAGRKLPLILNETPGVYANAGGGGAGDSEISIRGFSNNNVAVMINGVPVNDMENGRVYWSNWDLGDVTKSIQVQRGLSASKLATPSVGGTLNVLTKGFENKRGGIARQELGSNGYTKTSVMLSSGKLEGDWAVTVFGSRRKGNGWVEGAFDDSYTYFANISKKFGKHTVSLTGLGSPQEHGQRSFHGGLYKIREYDTEKALELGSTIETNPDGSVKGNYGFDYNADYGSLDRYTVSNDDTTHNSGNYNSQQNFYHKPQINLNHFWAISDKLFVSNVVYASIGNGGGTYLAGTIPTIDGHHTNFQKIYNTNYTNKIASAVSRSSINNHNWYGFISGLDYKANEKTTISLGLDGRSYKGEHYAEVTDLLGADYVTVKSSGLTGNNNLDINKKLYKGDKFGNTYDGIVKSIGGFAMAEYKTNVISAFLSGTISQTYYDRKNYSRAKLYTINGTETPIIYNTPVTINNIGYLPANYIIVKTKSRPGNPSVDTTLMLNPNSPVFYNTKSYQQVSGEGRLVESDPVKILGYSVKGGLNYNLNEFNNIFFNAGYISRPPFIDFIFLRNSGEKIPNVNNENVISFETGYGINRSNFKINLNSYYTLWKNKATTVDVPKENGEGIITFNVSGMNARHVGVEMDLAYEISRKVELNSAISLGDWRWTSSGIARGFDETGEELPEVNINAKNVHVGGSAQNQFMLGLRYEPIKGFYIRPTYLLFSKNYINFDPKVLQQEVPQDSYRLPSSRNVDIHTGYSFNFYRNMKLSLNGSVLNVLDEYYIMNVNPTSTPNDPNKMEAFFNRGRTFILGASVSF